ncbi:MAG TPA: COR domain-containing protein [Candidatus Dormibacteraeota bacterium]|nr:COR domain-containing protein [Candidatus Dormibacteraeota bacterium]
MVELTENERAVEAERRVDEAELTRPGSLDLSGLGLTSVPESVTRLSRLVDLDLSFNEITTLPDFLGQMTNLRSLVLHGNRLDSLPGSIAQLVGLLYLDLSRNQLEAFPEPVSRLSGLVSLGLYQNRISVFPNSLAGLNNLRTLYLYGNRIQAIPDSLAQISKLEFLALANNQISTIPDCLAELPNLSRLYLQDNRIDAVPDSLAQSTSLTVLNLSRSRLRMVPDPLEQLENLQLLFLEACEIAAIPNWLWRLSKLQKLGLNNNQIAAVPESITRLSQLVELHLQGNPLPEEVLAALKLGVPSFFRYLKTAAAGKVYPRTVKLVLLGEPGSGKTTLLEALKGNQHPCDDSRPETVGVDVVRIQQAHPADNLPMHLSVWDFAGQHIEHATHQFFLTENAIYLIVWNARQGADSGRRDLWYWLELLKMRVRSPKFLLVATHTEHTPPDLNLSEIQRSYPGCEGNFPIELQDLEGFEALQAKLLEVAAASPSLRAEWPAKWLPVRDEIRRIGKKQPHMTPAAFRRLMREEGVTDPVAQKDLAGQLHNLGEILYFQERDELSSLVILNPEWVTELIALVVRSEGVRLNHGILRRQELANLWKQRKLQPRVRDHLIRLMDWFDLTYSTGDRNDLGIVVEALPFSTPKNLEEIRLSETIPRMEMIFRFPALQRRLPPGMPTWAFARAHRFSKCKPWRDAAAFEDHETKSQALILSSEASKEIRLCVSGDYPPFFLGLLESILRDTFKRYPGVAPERRLPCSCVQGCKGSFLYGVVVGRWNDGKIDITCGETGRDVAIKSLLTGARRPPETEEGLHALRADMRRLFTEQIRAHNEQMEKTRPSVFTLLPSKRFKQLESWMESVIQEEELELTLFCEHYSGWHTTANSVYRFTPDKAWFDRLKKQWNQLVNISRYVGPLAKAAGKVTAAPALEAAGLGLEKLPAAPRSATNALSQELGETGKPEVIDIETRYLLEQLIDFLDSSERSGTRPKNGGLHPYLIEDGRLLWLCADHLNQYRKR